MKKLVLLALVAALVVPAMAEVTLKFTDLNDLAGQGVKESDFYGGWWAVEIRFQEGNVQGLPGANFSGGYFTTFCLERGETLLGFDNNTFTATFENTIAYGIPGAPINLRDETAWLYDQYRKGYNFGIADANVRAGAVQDAIWFGQENYTSAAGNYYDSKNSEDIWKLAVDAVQDGWTNNNYKVLRMMGQINGELTHAQDVIAVVPAPGAILLTGIGTTLVGWLRRRRAL